MVHAQVRPMDGSFGFEDNEAEMAHLKPLIHMAGANNALMNLLLRRQH
jgi:hypothetical protein